MDTIAGYCRALSVWVDAVGEDFNVDDTGTQTRVRAIRLADIEDEGCSTTICVDRRARVWALKHVNGTQSLWPYERANASKLVAKLGTKLDIALINALECTRQRIQERTQRLHPSQVRDAG